MVKSFWLAGSLVGISCVCGPAGAHAQTIANDVLRCGAIADDTARLRCFDGLIPDARKSEAERRVEAEAKAKADFGLTATQRNDQFKRDHPEKQARQRIEPERNLLVEATIAGFDMGPYGAMFTLDNGQIWQTNSFGGLSTVPRIGQKVTIESGPLGGYRLTLEGKAREVGVKRVK